MLIVCCCTYKYDLLLNCNKYEAGFVVVSQLTTEAILELNFMMKCKVTIDMRKAELNIGREDPITIHQPSKSPHDLGSVCLINSLKIPSLFEIVVMAYTNGLLTQGGT